MPPVNIHLIKKIFTHPFFLIKLLLYKRVIQKIKYSKRGGDYDAENYWRDRLYKYNSSLLGPGDEGLSEADNMKMFQKKSERLLELIEKYHIPLLGVKILEIGCGNGYYTNLLIQKGANDITSIDITDTLFPILGKQYPNVQFIKKDISIEKICDAYDIIFFIDVVQNIVLDTKFIFSMNSIENALKSGGFFLATPVNNKESQSMFHVHFRTRESFIKALPQLSILGIEEFYNNSILIAGKK